MGLLNLLFGRKPQASTQSHAPPASDPDEWNAARAIPEDRKKPSGFVFLEGAVDIRVAGISFRPEAARAFVKATRAASRGGRGWGTITLEREPDNPHGSTAIKVMATAPGGRQAQHIGYIPADISAIIAEQFLPDLPLAATLRSVGSKGEFNSVAIDVLIPKTSDRRTFER